MPKPGVCGARREQDGVGGRGCSGTAADRSPLIDAKTASLRYQSNPPLPRSPFPQASLDTKKHESPCTPVELCAMAVGLANRLNCRAVEGMGTPRWSRSHWCSCRAQRLRRASLLPWRWRAGGEGEGGGLQVRRVPRSVRHPIAGRGRQSPAWPHSLVPVVRLGLLGSGSSHFHIHHHAGISPGGGAGCDVDSGAMFQHLTPG